MAALVQPTNGVHFAFGILVVLLQLANVSVTTALRVFK